MATWEARSERASFAWSDGLCGTRLFGRERRREQGEFEAISEFVRKISGFQEIFIGEKKASAIFDSVDMILTGVGVLQRDQQTGRIDKGRSGDFLQERFAQHDDLSDEWLDQCTCGDVGGIVLPRQHLGDEAKQEVERFNQGWIGLTEQKLTEVSERAAKRRTPGVVIIAQDRKKARVVEAAVRQGIALNVIATEQVAEEMERIYNMELEAENLDGDNET